MALSSKEVYSARAPRLNGKTCKPGPVVGADLLLLSLYVVEGRKGSACRQILVVLYKFDDLVGLSQLVQHILLW
jgi:hypothetical protein